MESVVKSFWDQKIGKRILAVGTILSVVLGVVSIWLYFYKEAPKLEVEILSANSLFSVNETVPQMQIRIDSVDLQKQNKNITIYSLRIANNGSKNISLYDFDTGDIGIRINGGSIIETPSITDCSSDYIVHKVDTALLRSTDFSIIIPQAIYNVDDYYTLHFFVLHDKTQSPAFESFGQIVGQKGIKIVNHNNANLNNWKRAFSGSFYVQLYRLLVYGLALLLLFVIGAALFHWLSILWKWISKEVLLCSLKHRNGSNYIVVNDFRKNKYKNILIAYRMINTDSERLTELYKSAKVYLESNKEDNNDRFLTICKERVNIYHELSRLGYLIIKNDDSVVFNFELKDAVVSINHYFEENDRRNYGLGYGFWEDEVLFRESKEE